MGRGKIEYKKIENPTNMQVTFSKRRSGITKKAQELSVLCDAEICLILRSNTGRFYDFISPKTTAKKIIEKYQKEKAPDLWRSQHEKMQEELNKLRERNFMLKREIRHRKGRELHDVGFDELVNLEVTISSALTVIHEAKLKDMKKKKTTLDKKVRSLEIQQRILLRQIAEKYEECRLMEGEYMTEYTQINHNSEYGVTHLYAFPLHHGRIL